LITRLRPNPALQRSGWSGAILRSRCGKQDFSIYQRGSSSRPLNAKPFGGADDVTERQKEGVTKLGEMR